MRNDAHTDRTHMRLELTEIFDKQVGNIGVLIRLAINTVGTKYLIAIRTNRHDFARFSASESIHHDLCRLLLEVVIFEVLVQFTATVFRTPDDDAIEANFLQNLLRQQRNMRRVVRHTRKVNHKLRWRRVSGKFSEVLEIFRRKEIADSAHGFKNRRVRGSLIRRHHTYSAT